MDEEILEATKALCISPQADRSHRATSSLAASSTHRRHLEPLDLNRIPVPSLNPDINGASSADADIRTPFASKENMSGGVKRPRRGSLQAGRNASESLPASKLARIDRDCAGSNAQAAIVISDSDDAADQIDDQEALDASLDDSPTAFHRQNLANLYTYHTPTKTRTVNKPDPDTLPKTLNLQPAQSTAELPSARKASTTTPNAEASVPMLSANSPLPTDNKPKKSKGLKRATIQLKKTLEAAKELRVTPLNLDRVSSAGFRLITRCSFCAGAFAKSASTKVKQEHMSWCAPLQGVERAAAAVHTVSSDISRALQRDEQDKKKAAEERTLLQDVMHNADIIMHEGRASQIATSSKMRGRVKVLTKKPIKRAVKSSVLVAEDPASIFSIAPQPPGHNLLPARKAMLAARDLANQIFGNAVSLLADSSESKGVGDAELINELPQVISDANLASTLRGFSSQSINGDTNQAKHLPLVSAEQVFASMASTSPQKSPVKALQKSRQRQLSREQDTSMGLEDLTIIPKSPNPPQTQPFAPSKLAQRQQMQHDKPREPLFGAETTSRSLLDLIQKSQAQDESGTHGESKRKADENSQRMGDNSAKRTRLDTEDHSTGTHRHRLRKVMSQSGSPCSLDRQEMDVDDEPIRPASSARSDKMHLSCTGKLQEQSCISTPRFATNTTVATNDIEPKAFSNFSQRIPIDGSHRDETVTKMGESLAPILDADSLVEQAEDDDEDSKSFLDMLEPLDVTDAPAVSRIPYLSEPSSDDVYELETREISYMSTRMLVACSGANTASEYRQGTNLSAIPMAIPMSISPCSSFMLSEAAAKHEQREPAVSDSDPEL